MELKAKGNQLTQRAKGEQRVKGVTNNIPYVLSTYNYKFHFGGNSGRKKLSNLAKITQP
jgi:hypothetical protein